MICTHPVLTLPHRDDENATPARDWFASAKRSLLAPFGVGTVDQALLAIVAARHFFVRRFALAGKVVIVDEVHSYDIYTGTLVGRLRAELEQLGCTVILLSTTLTRSRRNTLLGAFGGDDALERADPYPLISGRSSQGEPVSAAEVAGPPPKVVALRFRSEDEALASAADKACDGACILWICNTVGRAQAIYRKLRAMPKGKFDIGLLHARFPLFRREELETRWMTALGKDGPRPDGCVLVSTQIVEQRVDLDADLMVSELAPTDMLLQRMGRLWRHEPCGPPTEGPECWIIREEKSLEELRQLSTPELKKILGLKAWVYAPYVLLRTLEVWSQRTVIAVPGEIRLLLETTYTNVDDLPALVVKRHADGLGGALTIGNVSDDRGFDLYVGALLRKSGQVEVVDLVKSVLHVSKQMRTDAGRVAYETEVGCAERVARLLGWAVETCSPRAWGCTTPPRK